MCIDTYITSTNERLSQVDGGIYWFYIFQMYFSQQFCRTKHSQVEFLRALGERPFNIPADIQSFILTPPPLHSYYTSNRLKLAPFLKWKTEFPSSQAYMYCLSCFVKRTPNLSCVSCVIDPVWLRWHVSVLRDTANVNVMMFWSDTFPLQYTKCTERSSASWLLLTWECMTVGVSGILRRPHSIQLLAASLPAEVVISIKPPLTEPV